MASEQDDLAAPTSAGRGALGVCAQAGTAGRGRPTGSSGNAGASDGATNTAVPGSSSRPSRPIVPPPPPPPPRTSAFAYTRHVNDTGGSSDDLEGKIGKLWLNRIGVAAILIGVAYFIEYTSDSQLIGAASRIALGLLSGIAVIMLSEIVRRQGQVAFSWSLKAVGIMLCTFHYGETFQAYHLVPAEVAFGAMLLVTVFTVILALTQDAGSTCGVSRSRRTFVHHADFQAEHQPRRFPLFLCRPAGSGQSLRPAFS